MRKTPGLIAAAAGVLVLLCVPAGVFAQSDTTGGRVASLAPGTIQGQVRDETGAPIGDTPARAPRSSGQLGASRG